MAEFSNATGRYVTIDVLGDECRVFFLESGEGQPLLCQHTAGCHNHQWRYLLEDEEITKDYRVIAYDLTYHGKSDPPKNREWWKKQYLLTAEWYTAFITSLCDALGIENPIFMGCSFGGNEALQLALHHPDRFGGIISVEGADYSPGFFLDWWQHPHANAAQISASGVWDLMAPQSPDADRSETWFYYTQGSEAFRGDLYFYSVDHDLRGRLGEIDTSHCPLVMLTGRVRLPHPSLGEQAHRRGHRKVRSSWRWKKIGHFPMSENYPVFKGYLQQALTSIAQKSGVRS